MKLSSKAALTSALVASLPVVQAAENIPFEFGANVTLATDMISRGMSFTDEGYAMQGTFDVEHESGVYVMTWGSNVKLLEDETVKPEDRATMGLILYAGYRGDLGEVSYDANINRVLFLGAGSHLNYDMTEFHIDFSYTLQGIDLGLAYDYSPDFFSKRVTLITIKSVSVTPFPMTSISLEL